MLNLEEFIQQALDPRELKRGLSWKKSQKSKASSWMAANHCAIGTWLTAARRREGLGCDRFGIGVVESFF